MPPMQPEQRDVMNDTHQKQLVSGIVFRLRLVFFVIALVLFTAVLVGYTQLRKLTVTVDDLTDSSLSVFIKTETTSHLLAHLLVLLQRVDRETETIELAKIKSHVTQILETLKFSAAEPTKNKVYTATSLKILEALHNIGESTSDLMQLRSNIIETSRKISDQLMKLSQHHQKISEIVELLSYEVVLNSNDILIPANETQTASQIIEQYHKNLSTSASITSIAMGIESVFDTATRLKNPATPEDIETSERILQHKINGITVLIGQIPESEMRQNLALQIIEVRSLLFASTGLLTNSLSLEHLKQEYSKKAIGQHSPIFEITELSDITASQARHNIKAKRADVFNVTSNMKSIISASLLFAAIISGVAVYFIVERQIGRRMATLTLAVRNLASGDTAHVVAISGRDELGEIAEALEVFKTNAEELKRSNTELEKFAYVAAHDLRSPLRAIQDLAEWTIEDPENRFSAEGSLNMSLLRSRIHRLSRLLSDLLEYSRVGKQEDDIALVSVPNIVSDLSELLDPQNDYHIEASGDIELVATYATPLRQILLNLINNAIKHHDQVTGHISVNSQIVAEHIVIKVYDDGPGILPKYHDRIFELFQTLRPRDEVEGSGLGLAIIRKLLEHYQCSIRIHSDPSQRRGTLFVFNLPKLSIEDVSKKSEA